MPLVLAYRDPGKVSEEFFSKLTSKLQGIVAEALSVPGTAGELKLGEIEVWVCDAQPGDVNTLPLEIIIWANYYPKRKKNLDERRARIVKEIKKLIPENLKITGFVWVLLAPASFEEF